MTSNIHKIVTSLNRHGISLHIKDGALEITLGDEKIKNRTIYNGFLQLLKSYEDDIVQFLQKNPKFSSFFGYNLDDLKKEAGCDWDDLDLHHDADLIKCFALSLRDAQLGETAKE